MCKDSGMGRFQLVRNGLEKEAGIPSFNSKEVPDCHWREASTLA